jgi:hypothetical protein
MGTVTTHTLGGAYMQSAESLRKYYNPPEADKRSRWDFLRRHQI